MRLFLIFAMTLAFSFSAYAQVSMNWKTSTSIAGGGQLTKRSVHNDQPKQEIVSRDNKEVTTDKPQLKTMPDGTQVIQKKIKLKDKEDGFWSNLFN